MQRSTQSLACQNRPFFVFYTKKISPFKTEGKKLLNFQVLFNAEKGKALSKEIKKWYLDRKSKRKNGSESDGIFKAEKDKKRRKVISQYMFYSSTSSTRQSMSVFFEESEKKFKLFLLIKKFSLTYFFLPITKSWLLSLSEEKKSIILFFFSSRLGNEAIKFICDCNSTFFSWQNKLENT